MESALPDIESGLSTLAFGEGGGRDIMTSIVGVQFAQESGGGGFGVVLVLWLVIGPIVGHAIGKPKGRAGEGLALGLFLGIFGWLIIALLSPTADIQRQNQPAGSGGPRRPCPSCAEDIKYEASVCRFCGRDVEPMTASSNRYAFAPPTVPANWKVHQRDYDNVRASFPDEAAEIASENARQPIDGMNYLQLKNTITHMRKGISAKDAVLRVTGPR